MNAVALYRELTERGVMLWQEEDRLRFHAPAQSITPHHVDAMRKCKVELLALLGTNDRPMTRPARAIVHFRFKAGAGGTLIDPDGMVSAMHALAGVYGARLDWKHLLTMLDTCSTPDKDQAIEIVRQFSAL